MASLFGEPILVIGEIQGSVQALPKLINFGTLNAGEQPVQRVTLTGSLHSLQGIKVQCDNRLLTVSMVGPLPRIQASRYNPPHQGPNAFASNKQANQGTDGAVFLDCEIDKMALPGLLQAQVIVTFKDNTRLVLPVVANITRSDH